MVLSSFEERSTSSLEIAVDEWMRFYSLCEEGSCVKNLQKKEGGLVVVVAAAVVVAVAVAVFSLSSRVLCLVEATIEDRR